MVRRWLVRGLVFHCNTVREMITIFIADHESTDHFEKDISCDLGVRAEELDKVSTIHSANRAEELDEVSTIQSANWAACCRSTRLSNVLYHI